MAPIYSELEVKYNRLAMTIQKCMIVASDTGGSIFNNRNRYLIEKTTTMILPTR